MTISSVVDIVHGALLNTPSITRVGQIRVNARKVRRGDLFISLFDDETDLAIANGAYAVIVPKSRNAKDDETAWIAVEDPNEAMLRLLRYLLSKKEVRFIYCDTPLFAVASAMLGKNRSVLMMGGSVFNLVDTLIEREDVGFCLSADRGLLQMLSGSVEELPQASRAPDIIKESLMQTELMFGGQRLFFPVATRLGGYIAEVLEFCESHDLQWGFDHQRLGETFCPYYLDRRLHIVPQPTNRMIIVDRVYSGSYLQESVRFVRENLRWGKTVLLSDTPVEGVMGNSSPADLHRMLQGVDFHFAYVASHDPDALITALMQPDSPVDGSSLF